jgi:hypothetical protein
MKGELMLRVVFVNINNFVTLTYGLTKCNEMIKV